MLVNSLPHFASAHTQSPVTPSLLRLSKTDPHHHPQPSLSIARTSPSSNRLQKPCAIVPLGSSPALAGLLLPTHPSLRFRRRLPATRHSSVASSRLPLTRPSPAPTIQRVHSDPVRAPRFKGPLRTHASLPYAPPRQPLFVGNRPFLFGQSPQVFLLLAPSYFNAYT